MESNNLYNGIFGPRDRAIIQKVKMIKATGEAETYVETIKAETECNIERRREVNRIELFAMTRNNLIKEKNVSDEKVDEDWVVRFFNIAQDINNKDLDIIWAKLLAGEVCNPGSYSLRTLEVLKNLSSEEARVFTKVVGLVSDQWYIVKFDSSVNCLEKYGLKYESVLSMRDAGLLTDGDTLNYSTEAKEMRLGRAGFQFMSRNKGIKLDIFKLTTAGKEIMNIIPFDMDQDYIRDFKNFLVKQGYIISQ